MRILNILSDIFSKHIFKNNNETIVYKNTEPNSYVVDSRKGYTIYIELDENYIYFRNPNTINRNFCIKRPINLTDDIDSIKKIIEKTRIFHLLKIDYENLISKFYVSIFRLFGKGTKPIDPSDFRRIEFNSNYYSLINIETNIFFNNIYKININYKYFHEKNKRFYLFNDYLISYISFDNFLPMIDDVFKSRTKNDYSHLIDTNLLKTKTDIYELINTFKLSMLNIDSCPVFLYKYKGKKVLLGLQKTFMTNQENRHNKLNLTIENQKVKLSKGDLNPYDIDDSLYFVMYSISGKKINKEYFKASKSEVVKLITYVFKKIKRNRSLILKYPSNNLLKEMYELGIIEKNASITQEHIDIYYMIKI